MRKIIHKLRSKPEKERREMLHLFIIIATIVMLILWGFSLEKNFNNQETKRRLKEDVKPFKVLKDNMVDGYNTIVE